jgi:hypothetical protein
MRLVDGQTHHSFTAIGLLRSELAQRQRGTTDCTFGKYFTEGRSRSQHQVVGDERRPPPNRSRIGERINDLEDQVMSGFGDGSLLTRGHVESRSSLP